MTKIQKGVFLTITSLTMLTQSFFFKQVSWFNIKTGMILNISLFLFAIFYVFYTKRNNWSTYIIIALGVVFMIAQLLFK